MKAEYGTHKEVDKFRKFSELEICKFILIIQNLAIFFPNIINAITSIQVICLFLYTFCFFIFNRKIKLFKFLSLWGIYLILVIVNIFVGGDISFIVAFLVNNLLMLMLLNIPELAKIEMKIMKAFTSIHLLASLAVVLLPQGIIDFVFKIILGSGFSSNYDWRVAQNMNPGITTQPGVNAMNLSLFCMICVAEILSLNKKKFFRIVCMLLAFIMIFTTAKRSAIFITLLSIALFYLYINRYEIKKISINKVIIAVMGILSVCVLGFYIYSSTDIFKALIDKTLSLESMKDITNGRFEIWGVALERFTENPILGIGFKSMYEILGLDVHNTYIQMLVETGLLGFVFFILGVFVIFRYSLANVNKGIFSNNDSEMKATVGIGFMLMLFLLIYGFVGNTFIDYFPLMLFTMSVFMINAAGGK